MKLDEITNVNIYETIKLENQICFSLYVASKEIIRLYKPLLEKYNLTYTQYLTMMVIWEKDNISIKELGEKLRLDSGTLTPLIKKLEKMELVEKYRDADDERVVRVTLLEKGNEMKKNIVEVPKNLMCKFQSKMEDMKLLKKLLDESIAKMEEI